ncbi:hypothetical protein BABINDRAFT_58918 [Babjeviella inositovora NRRL Y-12698]|uniref:Cns1/TTC4 wheel domain-containing protein n=1 Tax=Babjeviella inositovora NRRL Y-12698 TaxID=984486 RepID=A0A1E3QWG8_9ASCO|nr:uncharacterized protein BABINDRAFT_58918 [Babjeviella inositovora NRRL Y-12698]ODQ82006.1 hypothetical protein BABINDRAFT_58918 [Babjeviella inositovora NRRL Y-12698]
MSSTGQPELPPQLQNTAQKVDDVMKELNRMPFFMTQLDETDGEGGENLGLEALKALAYEGEPDEVATNFKNQGNDCYKGKQYKNAIEFYTKGLEMKCGVDALEASLYLNRAACNLELKNYRKCVNDCKLCLKIDPKNIKAYFRSCKAYFGMDRLDEAIEVAEYALALEPENTAIRSVLATAQQRKGQFKALADKKQREAQEKQMKQVILANAINLRHILVVKTPKPAALLGDAKLRLEDETDYGSQLIFPAMVVYPTTDEFDFIAEISELTTPAEMMEMVLNRPAAFFAEPQHQNFHPKKMEAYMETETGGLIRVGKKVAINNVLMADKPSVPLFDNSLRIYFVPKVDSVAWIATWDKEIALKKRL